MKYTMALDAATEGRARQWILHDPNPATLAHVQHLLDTLANEELVKLFPDDRIAFGTAGLRSAMKPGPMGMNDLVVVQAAQGLARYSQKVSNGKGPLLAVVGYDHRAYEELQLSSLSFAILTALVFRQAGMECLLLEGYSVTPLVPFCVSQLSASVGVMITASHNPKRDAGYKVYAGDACQIRSPMDGEIADLIDKNLEPWTDYRAMIQQRCRDYPDDPCLGLSDADKTSVMKDRYFVAVQNKLVTGQGQLSFETPARPPKFCYTAMHGVGHKYAQLAFETFGLPAFYSVPEQQEPDPTFPTVIFPNPEEKGALDRVKAAALEQGCDIVLANDPDADRLAVAEYANDQWTVFTGDQIGVMLGHWLFEQIGRKSKKTLAMCASTVSSKMLAEIATREGFYFEDTLTGFKWIGSRCQELHQSDEYEAIFGYEEAIGFCCGNVIFDKDGISALGVFGELSMAVYYRGMTLAQHLQSLYDKYGEFVCNNGYYFLADPSVVSKIMDSITNNGKFDRTHVGEYEIEAYRYLGEPGYDSRTEDKKPTLRTSKSSPMLAIYFANGCVAQFRASGTEPKFKYYVELKGAPGVSREQVTAELAAMSSCILEELLQPSQNGLQAS